jgi:hypothetical protein
MLYIKDTTAHDSQSKRESCAVPYVQDSNTRKSTPIWTASIKEDKAVLS